MTRTLSIILASLLIACSDGSDPETEPAGTSDATAAGETAAEDDTGPAASPLDCQGEMFLPSPLAGPGIDPETGAIVGTPANAYILHTTQAVVAPETAGDFIGMTGPVMEQLMQTNGLIGFSASSETSCGFARTLGIWESEEAMYEFVYSGAHAQAMAAAREITVTGRFTHFDIDPGDLDRAWDLAFEALEDVEPPPLYD